METQPIPEDTLQRLVDLAADVFDIQDVTPGYFRGQGVRLRGRLRIAAEDAYNIIAPRFEALGYTTYLRREGDMHVLLAEPGLIRAKKLDVRVNVVLFVLTVASVLFTGVTTVSPAQNATLDSLWPGLAFAVGLLAILIAHEMAHYFVARHFGVPISLPYFIPFPLTLFGTMGATEIMQGRPKNRRALLAVGAAGPLAGVLLAIPILILGLFLSEVQPVPTDGSYFVEGNSLLYLGIKYLLFGRILPGGGYDVFIHPIVFAGWGGLLVTALNLIPAGQLDGGHILYALLGKRSRWFAWPILIGLIILGTQWAGWYLWAALIFFLGRAYAEPFDEITELSLRERILAIGMMILFVLVFVPVPFQVG
jgi:membrane-associated protease RseP (regulator of RpoE activity)